MDYQHNEQTIQRAVARQAEKTQAEHDKVARYDETMSCPASIHQIIGDILQDESGEELAKMIIDTEKASRNTEMLLKLKLADYLIGMVTDEVWRMAENK